MKVREGLCDRGEWAGFFSTGAWTRLSCPRNKWRTFAGLEGLKLFGPKLFGPKLFCPKLGGTSGEPWKRRDSLCVSPVGWQVMDSEPPLVEGPLGASNWRDTRWTALEEIPMSTFLQGSAPLVEGPLGASNWRDTRWTALEKISMSTFLQGLAVITRISRAGCVVYLARKFPYSVTLLEELAGFPVWKAPMASL